MYPEPASVLTVPGPPLVYLQTQHQQARPGLVHAARAVSYLLVSYGLHYKGGREERDIHEKMFKKDFSKKSAYFLNILINLIQEPESFRDGFTRDYW